MTDNLFFFKKETKSLDNSKQFVYQAMLLRYLLSDGEYYIQRHLSLFLTG